ncbi:MFS transporter [Dyella terrae]|uniref:MFS transporter n=1 Tax=Dyella terrae TaxID=522259 RepID=UPI001EFE2128|nr:MFS transporter [Dyella terrae]ULU25700.1 MFS transporter [Dyella terrae]
MFRRHRITLVYLFGFSLDLVNMFASNVAMPSIGTDLHTSTGTLAWISAAYTLGLTLAIPCATRWASAWGERATLLASLGGFAVAALLAGIAPNASLLVVCRLAQGLAGGLLIPVGQAWAYRLTPVSERAALTTRIMAIALFVPALSPWAGGLLTQWVSWRALLAASAPAALVVFALAASWLPSDQTRLPHVPFLSSVPRLLRIPTLRLPMLIYLLVPGVFVGVNLVAAIDLARRGFAPTDVGVLMLPWAMASAVGIGLSRRWFARQGPRRLFFIGMVAQSLGIAWLATVREGGHASAAVAYLCMGFGGSLCSSTAQTLAFLDIAADDMLPASAAWNLNRQWAFFIGPVALGGLLAVTGHATITYVVAACLSLAPMIFLRRPILHTSSPHLETDHDHA